MTGNQSLSKKYHIYCLIWNLNLCVFECVLCMFVCHETKKGRGGGEEETSGRWGLWGWRKVCDQEPKGWLTGRRQADGEGARGERVEEETNESNVWQHTCVTMPLLRDLCMYSMMASASLTKAFATLKVDHWGGYLGAGIGLSWLLLTDVGWPILIVGES